MLKLTTQHALLAVSALTLGVVAAQVGAQETPTNEGYATDSRGQVVKSASGQCYRLGYWTPAMANIECDPDLVPKPKPAPPPPPPPAPAPPPPPPPPPPPKPVTEKVTFKADVLFDFNKAVLKPEGKEALDGLVNKLQGTALEVIVAVGYTDPIGGDAYNQKLSVARADAVKAYLVSKGIAAERVYAEGKGKADQIKVCSPKEYKTQKALIECLAPNRRVQIEAVGTQTK